MSARSIGRGICPKCGLEGSVVIKQVGGKDYVYVKHGRTWHYIGPLDKVDLNTILIGYTTTLPLKGSSRVGKAMGGQGKPLSKVIAKVLGVLLIAIGAILVLIPLLFLPVLLPATGYAYVSGSGLLIVNGSDKAYLFSTMSNPITVNVMTIYGTRFKVLVTRISSLPPPLNNTLSTAQITVGHSINITEIKQLLPNFLGDYTNYTATISPGELLIVWPYEVYEKPALLTFVYRSMPIQAKARINVVNVVIMASPLLIIAAVLMYGGYELYRWSRS
ncbi:MAG: hypothetical protein RXR10_03080 [Vulcanisaeta sp.]